MNIHQKSKVELAHMSHRTMRAPFALSAKFKDQALEQADKNPSNENNISRTIR